MVLYIKIFNYICKTGKRFYPYRLLFKHNFHSSNWYMMKILVKFSTHTHTNYMKCNEKSTQSHASTHSAKSIFQAVRKLLWSSTPTLWLIISVDLSHGWRSLVGYSPWGRKESDMTERLHFFQPNSHPAAPATSLHQGMFYLQQQVFSHLQCRLEAQGIKTPENSNSSSEKAMATHFSTLAWRIPWMEEHGRLQSMGSLRVGHDWATSLSLFTFMHWRRKWQPTPVFSSSHVLYISHLYQL